MSTYPTPRLVVRLYDNPKLGSRNGPRRKNQLVFNGKVDINDDQLYVDLAPLEHIDQSTDPTAAHMSLLLSDMAAELAQSPQHLNDVLVGQIKEVKPTCYFDGGIVLNLRTREVRAFLYDEGALAFYENLSMERCRTPRGGENSPNYLAANCNLGPAPARPDEAARSKATAMLDQMKKLRNPPSNTVVTADAVISILRSSAG